MANPELGAKQVCPNCQAKFYDLNRRPAHCPKCGTDFDPEEALKLRSRRARPGYPSDDEDTEDQVKDKSADGEEDEEGPAHRFWFHGHKIDYRALSFNLLDADATRQNPMNSLLI